MAKCLPNWYYYVVLNLFLLAAAFADCRDREGQERMPMDRPDTFLELVIHNTVNGGDDLTLCAGFERGEWRRDQLANHVMEWLPEFALSHTELMELGHHNAIKLTKKAAQIVYQTEKYGLRGEFGEILLHIAIRQVYQTIPAVSKIFYKSAVNETVKGFDAVHVVRTGEDLELWIGETKFYDDLNRAIRDVCAEIVDHLETDYLRSEFILIQNKIDPAWPGAEELKRLLNQNTSLDKVFKKACIPVLLTYDSTAVGSACGADDAYQKALVLEVEDAYSRMRDRLGRKYCERFGSPLPVTLHVILIPLKEKKSLIAALDTRLKALQL